MERLIVQLGIMSVQAAIVICVILLVRMIFARLHVPKKYVMLLWIIPYFLMVCPWKIESSFSFWQVMEHRQMDSVQTVVQHVQYELEQKGEEITLTEEWRETVPREESTGQAVNMGALQEDPLTNGSDSSTAQLPRQDVTTITPINRNSMEFVELLLQAATVLWLVGAGTILIYSIVSYGKLKGKVLCSICMSENIYYADDIDSPFVLGIFRPRIYLPSSMKQENLHYVLEHERTHIRKKDPLKKMLAFGLSIIHWFNPFVWVAFAFFGKDMEMACDEETIARLGIDKKQDYATALLQLASGKRRLLGAPLAFGEGNVKTRIRNIVKYKKVWKIVSVVAVLVVVVLAVGFLTEHNAVTTLGALDADDHFVGFGNQSRRIQLTMEGKTTDFPEAYFESFMEFIKETEIEKIPLSLSRAEDRAKDVQIQIGESGYIYLNSDCSEIWSNDGVKPSKSYGIVNPQAVQEFLKKQVNSVVMVEEAKPDNIRSEQNSDLLSESAVQVPITKPVLSEETEEGVAGVFLDYASERMLVFHDHYGLFVYNLEKGLIGEINLQTIGMKQLQGSNAWSVEVEADGSRIYMHGMEETDMYIYDAEQNMLYWLEKYDVNGIEMFREVVNCKDYIEPDYTVNRSEKCVILEECYHYLESGSGLPIDMCWVIQQYPQTEQETKQYIKIFESYEGESKIDNNTVEATPPPLTEPITAEFTMEDLITLCKANKVAETMEDYVQKDGLLPSNIGRSYKEDALSWSYYFDLAYEGKSYTLRANYWNPLNAQEYGHAPNQLFEVILYENTAGDALMLYSNDYRHAAAVPIMDIEEFLAKKYDITQELTLELPEGTYLGAYDMGMNDIFQGSLILMEDYEENPHGEWIPKAWYAPGGVGKTALTGGGAMEGRATFADNRLANFHWLMNHAGGELLEEVEACDRSALLYHYQFDVFTMQEVEEYAKEHGISVEAVPNITDYWYVFFADPENDFAYVVFLNQEYFSKEDILKLARSVKFQ